MSQTEQPNKKSETAKSFVGGRGPAYPFIALQKAVERAEQLRDANMIRLAAPPVAIYQVWGFSGESGNARQTLAALNHYGLIEYVGRGEQRNAKLTELAHRIVLDQVPNSPDRFKALQEAALTPEIHRKLWTQYSEALPPDIVIETFLAKDCGFNLHGAKNVVAEYRDTFHYAGFDKPVIMPAQAGGGFDAAPPKPQAAIGDLVQVELNGAFTLEQPMRLRAIKEHNGKDWGFLDGTETGVLMENVVFHSKGDTGSRLMPPTMELDAKPALNSGVTVISKSEREWLRGPLSKEVGYRLIVNGDLGPREIGKLIKLLEAQKAVLDDDDEG